MATGEATQLDQVIELTDGHRHCGAGAAGNAAAETLRREGYCGDVTMVSADDGIPYGRPALSKDFLEGNLDQEGLSLLDCNRF